MLRCQGGETDVELSGELFRNLSVNFLKSRETGNAPGRKEGIELSCATNRSSNRNALENLPKPLKKSPEKETGKTELTRGDAVMKKRKLSRRGNIKDSRQLSRKDIAMITEKKKRDSDTDDNRREWAEISGILDRSVLSTAMF